MQPLRFPAKSGHLRVGIAFAISDVQHSRRQNARWPDLTTPRNDCMNSARNAGYSPRDVAVILAVYWRRWLLPTVVLGALAAAYAVSTRPVWQASLGLMLRNAAAESDGGAGKFSRAEDMKTAQATILEVVKGRQVLEAALVEVGAPSTAARPWPSDADIDNLRQDVKLSPPKGAEFGTTEVFYLDVRDSNRTRAVALSRALCRQLQRHYQALRDAKARSMIDELSKAVRLANDDLSGATAQLAAIEKSVGSDLAELRGLQENNSGDSSLRRTVGEIENELRQTCTAEHADKELLGLLQTAEGNPGRVAAMPSRLLDSVPALRRLKEGLVDAQLKTASLEGRMSAEHPLVRAARESEEEIGRKLHGELTVAITGLKSDLRLHSDRTVLLGKQLADARQRLARLAGLRAAYANQVSETSERGRLLARAEQNLSEARVAAATAKAADLISCIDTPDTGIRPVSPSRALTVLAGVAGGLAVGLALVFLTVPTAAGQAGTANNGSAGATSVSFGFPLLHTARNAAEKLSLRQAMDKLHANPV
jgi:polysaccharide biosynthesis transport protein